MTLDTPINPFQSPPGFGAGTLLAVYWAPVVPRSAGPGPLCRAINSLPHALLESPLSPTIVLVAIVLVAYVVLNVCARFKQGLAVACACVLAAGGPGPCCSRHHRPRATEP